MHIEARVLVDALKDAGLRITAPRRAMCEILAASHDEHHTAASLLDRVNHLVGAEVAPSTIYRTIDVLESAGLLHHIHLGHGPGVVHLSDGSHFHHHLVCESCGEAVDVPIEEVEAALQSVAEAHGFVMGSVHFALVGRCSSCR